MKASKWPPWLIFLAVCSLSDGLTGLMLLADPVSTVHLFGAAIPMDSAIWLRWIGVFVFSVGATYGYGVLIGLNRGKSSRVRCIWMITAGTRTAVSLFLLISVVAGELPPPWLIVCCSDGGLAIIQYIWAWKGLFRGRLP